MSGVLRIITAIVVVATAVLAGYLHRAPWIIVLLTLSFSTLYIAGKLPQWRLLARSEGAPGIVKAMALTLPVQAILAGVFYLVGVGVGAIVGGRELAARLESFDLALAGGLLAFGLVSSSIIYVAEAQAAAPDPQRDLSPEIRAVMDEAFELGQQSVAMPVQIFSLARRLADHPDRAETLAAMAQFFDDDSAFVRRIPYTALRFMGQAGRDADPQGLDRRIVQGMRDPAVWVRYDAAWCAGVITGDDEGYAVALRQMIEDAVAAQANRADKNDAVHKALTRARDSLKLVEARSGG
jgi:hypothetical protein